MAYDAIIVGARCAGASLAMLLAGKGWKVLALDHARFPSDTVSTHFLWPRSTSFLAAWGLLDRLAATGCPPIASVKMHWGPVAIAGRPDPVDGTASMYCPRRTVLDALLVDAARRAGAEIRERTTVRDLLHQDGRIVGVRASDAEGGSYEARATVTIGADGVFSRVAAAAQAGMERSHPSLTCGFYAYWSGVPTEGVEFYMREGRDILVFPTHDELTCIWVGRPNAEWPAYRADIEGSYLAGLDPAIRERVRRGRQATPFKGTNKLPNYYRQCAGNGWALVGDAAYHRDPLTGMGIGDAFLGAQLLADALDECFGSQAPSALAGYGSRLRQRTEAVFDYTLQAASLKDPAPLAPIYAEIARRPDLTRQLMNILGGTAPAKSLFNAQNIAGLMRAGHGGGSGTAHAALQAKA